MPKVTAILATMPERIVRRNVSLVADNLLNDGMILLFSKLRHYFVISRKMQLTTSILQVPCSEVMVKADKEFDGSFRGIGWESLENISGKEDNTYSKN